MTKLIIIGIFIVIFGYIFCFALCKVASNADRQSEQFYKDELLKRKAGE